MTPTFLERRSILVQTIGSYMLDNEVTIGRARGLCITECLFTYDEDIISLDNIP